MKDLKITVIGAGHLGKSIIKNLLALGYENITATRRNEEKLGELRSLSPSLKLSTNNKEAVETADLVILTAKQDSFEAISEEIRDLVDGKLLISLGPTMSLEELEGFFGSRNIRLMMPVYPGVDIISFVKDEACMEGDVAIVEGIFGENCVEHEEKDMLIATAYVVLRGVMNSLLDPLLRKSVELGMDEELARETMGKLLISTGQEIIDGGIAEDRLEAASGGFNEKSSTLKLHKKLQPVQEQLADLFEEAVKSLE